MLDLKYVVLTCILYSLKRQSDLTVQCMTSGGCRDVEVVPNVTIADLEGVSYYLKYTSIILKTKIDGLKLDVTRAQGPPNNFSQHYAFINEQKEIRIVKSWGILTINEGVNQILNQVIMSGFGRDLDRTQFWKVIYRVMVSTKRTYKAINMILDCLANVTENYYILSFAKNEHFLMYICNPRVPISIDARVLYTTNPKLNMDEAVYIDKQNNFIGELQLLPNKNINFLMQHIPESINK